MFSSTKLSQIFSGNEEGSFYEYCRDLYKNQDNEYKKCTDLYELLQNEIKNDFEKLASKVFDEDVANILFGDATILDKIECLKIQSDKINKKEDRHSYINQLHMCFLNMASTYICLSDSKLYLSQIDYSAEILNILKEDVR